MPKQLTNALLLGLGLGLLIPAALIAAPQSDAVVARYHFAGSTQMMADTNMAKLKKIGALPETANFQGQVEQKIATLLAQSLGKQLNPSIDATPLLRPLMDDILQSESVADFGGRVDAPLGFVLAIRLDDARFRAWQDSFTHLLPSGAERVQSEGFEGLIWKKQSTQLIRAKDWVVISRGEDLKAQSAEFLRGVAQQGRPAPALRGNWLEGDADWPKLQAWLPLSCCPFKLARTEFSISAKADNLRTMVHVRYPETFQWKPTPWRVPVETIHDPLISFTAVQDPAPFLKPNPWLAQLRVNPWNQQFFIWGVEGLPFLTYGAIPVDHATNALKDLSTQLPAVFNAKLKELRFGEILWMTNRNEVAWQGLSLLAPELWASKEKSGEFLFGGLFPLSPKGKPAPVDLFAQFTSRNDLVYYDWELTGARLEQWRPTVRLLPILPQLRPSRSTTSGGPVPPPAATPGRPKSPTPAAIREKWLTAIAPLLGNSITEVSVTGPNELMLVRKSPIGLSSFELVWLSHWMTDGRLTATPPAPKAKP